MAKTSISFCLCSALTTGVIEPGRHAVVRVPTVHQVDNEFDLGPRLLREIVLVKRWRVPAFRAAATIGRRRPRAHKVTWSVAGAAVAETFDKVGTLVPLGILR